MAVRDTTQIAQPTAGASILPRAYPPLPDDVRARFSSLAQYQADVDKWYRQVRSIVGRDFDQIAFATNELKRGSDMLRNELTLKVGDIEAQLGLLAGLIEEGDNAVRGYINEQIGLVSGGGNRVKLQSEPPDNPAVGDLWFDLNDGMKRYVWNGSTWTDVTDQRLTDNVVAIANEITARMTADTAMAADIGAIYAQVNTGPTSLIGRLNTIEAVYVTTTGVTGMINSAIDLEIINRNSAITSAVTNEETARINADSAMAADIEALEVTINTPGTGLAAAVASIEATYVTTTEAEAMIADAIGSATTIGSKVFVQASAPASATLNDIWYDSDDGFRPYWWNGSAWADARDQNILGTLATAENGIATLTTTTDALAESYDALYAQVNTGPTSLSAKITNLETTKVDSTGATAAANSAISASLASGAAGTIGASIATESLARTTFNGQLYSTYSLRATAGNVISGMRFVASSGSFVDYSEVTFTVGAFRIFNGTAATPVFDLEGSTLKLAAGVVITSRVVPTVVANPATAGLYLGSDRMGYWDGSEWRAYFRNDGTFGVEGDANNYVRWNGSLLTVKGNLTATAGEIAGWTIGPTTIYKNNAVLDSAGEVRLGSTSEILILSASDPTYRIWAGSLTSGSAAFRVTKGGVLTATGANITGTINATSGSFTGAVTATSGSFTGTVNASSGSFTGAVTAGAGSSIDGAFLVNGTISSNKLAFTVTGSDNVIASINASTEGGGTLRISSNKLHISGNTTFDSGYDPSTKLDATTTISGDKIRTGSIQGNNWGASAGMLIDLVNDEIKIGGSSAPKFSVNSAGVLTAVGALITGTLVAGSTVSDITLAGTIVGGAISGTTLAIGSGITAVGITTGGITVGNMTLSGSGGQNTIAISGAYPLAINAGSAAGSIAIGAGTLKSELNGDGSSSGLVLGGDTRLYRSAANAFTTTASIAAGKLSTANFEANIATAVDVKDVNFRIFSGATQTFRVDYTTGHIYINNNRVVGSRGSRGSASLADVVALLDSWNAWG